MEEVDKKKDLSATGVKMPRWVTYVLTIGLVVLGALYLTGCSADEGEASEETQTEKVEKDSIPEEVVTDKTKAEEESGDYKDPFVKVVDETGKLDEEFEEEFIFDIFTESINFFVPKNIHAIFSGEHGLLYVVVEVYEKPYKDSLSEGLDDTIKNKITPYKVVNNGFPFRHGKLKYEYITKPMVHQEDYGIDEIVIDYTIDDRETLLYRVTGDGVEQHVDDGIVVDDNDDE